MLSEVLDQFVVTGLVKDDASRMKAKLSLGAANSAVHNNIKRFSYNSQQNCSIVLHMVSKSLMDDKDSFFPSHWI